MREWSGLDVLSVVLSLARVYGCVLFFTPGSLCSSVIYASTSLFLAFHVNHVLCTSNSVYILFYLCCLTSCYCFSPLSTPALGLLSTTHAFIVPSHLVLSLLIGSHIYVTLTILGTFAEHDTTTL